MKTNLDSIYKTDLLLEERGIWFTIRDGVGFLVSRFHAGNKRAQSVSAKYSKPFASQIQAGTLEPEKQRRILTRMFVETSMIDWKGIEIDGKETPYDPETAVEFFMALPDLCDQVREYASNPKSYLEELGNS